MKQAQVLGGDADDARGKSRIIWQYCLCLFYDLASCGRQWLQVSSCVFHRHLLGFVGFLFVFKVWTLVNGEQEASSTNFNLSLSGETGIRLYVESCGKLTSLFAFTEKTMPLGFFLPGHLSCPSTEQETSPQ